MLGSTLGTQKLWQVSVGITGIWKNRYEEIKYQYHAATEDAKIYNVKKLTIEVNKDKSLDPLRAKKTFIRK